MGVPRLRAALLAGALATLPMGLGGCDLGGDSGGAGGAAQTPAEDPGQEARARVQAYLDAMKVKSVATGRGQLCAPSQPSFDKAATGVTGDFASHFKVTAAQITDVRGDAGRQLVSTSITANVGKQTVRRAIDFTVLRTAEDWCITDEQPADPAASPGGAPQPSPSV